MFSKYAITLVHAISFSHTTITRPFPSFLMYTNSPSGLARQSDSESRVLSQRSKVIQTRFHIRTYPDTHAKTSILSDTVHVLPGSHLGLPLSNSPISKNFRKKHDITGLGEVRGLVAISFEL